MAPHPMLSAWHSPGGPDSLALLTGAIRAGLTVRRDSRRPRPTVWLGRHRPQGHRSGDCPRCDGRGGHGHGRRSGRNGGRARTARYAALDRARTGRPVLLGHTLDDQAETVLLAWPAVQAPGRWRGCVSGIVRGAARCSASAAPTPAARAPNWACPHSTTPQRRPTLHPRAATQ